MTTLLKSFDTLDIIAKTSSLIALGLMGIGLIVIPISTETACGLSVGNKVIYEININKCNNYQKQDEGDQLNIKVFNNLYRKSSQDIVFDKNEYESLCIIFTKKVDVSKNECFFINMNIKRKLFFF